MEKLLPFLLLLFCISVHSQTATVIAENANLRGTASAAGKVITTLRQESCVEVIKQRGV